LLLIFGTRAYDFVIVLVTFECPHCAVTAPQSVYRQATKVTFFFIPLFTISTSYYVECSNCATNTPLTKEQADHSMEWAASRRAASA
jgi:hypothetical protein